MPNTCFNLVSSIRPSFEGDYKWRKSKFSFAYSVIKTANYLSMVTTGETSDYRSFFFEGEKLFWLVPNLWRHVCMSFGESTKQLVFVLVSYDGNSNVHLLMALISFFTGWEYSRAEE